MPKHKHSDVHPNDHFIKHAHIPRSIWAAKVVWGRWEVGNSNIMVDIVQCPGCCDGPCALTTISNNWGGLVMPGFMKTVSCSHLVMLGGRSVLVDNCSGQQIALGDYGEYRNENLTPMGNIFEDMRTLGIDPQDSAYCPVVSRVSTSEFVSLPGRVKNANDFDLELGDCGGKHLVLHQPKATSLPVHANEQFALLLKALSTRLAGF
ncbi:hypothetical protein EDD16DRAFT_718280 [Pisolithus croceorrhizus]|nr:hypothetical protein EDD16DRAFT_718280 [Pisolithus croceorrhizus]KAI6101066.1 hypothetical protein EV401DRAFT_819757 [Pisolithus croceorrhizus]